MRLRAVALVLFKAVLRVYFRKLLHLLVAVHLREDARRADTVRERVSVDDVLLREGDVEAEISVGEHDVRPGDEALHRALHAQSGRFKNIDAVDGAVVLFADGVSDRALAYQRGEAGALPFFQLFAVVDALDELAPAEGHDHRRAHHGAGERPPAHLVGACPPYPLPTSDGSSRVMRPRRPLRKSSRIAFAPRS